MDKRLYILILMFALGLIISGVLVTSVESSGTLGTFKQNECINLKQVCADCTFVNISSVTLSSLPSSSAQLLDQVQMIKNGVEFNYTFCNTTNVGIYNVNGFGDPRGTNEIFVYDFEVTPSGFTRINSGEGIIIFIGLFIIFIIGILSFVLFLKVESFGLKITFLAIAGIFMLVSVLFTTVLIYQNLSGFGDVIKGYDAFVFIVRMGVTILILAFFVAILLFMLRAWKLKRGDYD